MEITRFEKIMATVEVFLMGLVRNYEDDPVMPEEISDWADPILWNKSCVRSEWRL